MSPNPHDALADSPSAAGAGPVGVVPVAREVADDLEAIFPASEALSGAGREVRLGRLRSRRTDGPPALERRLATLGALIAAACVGVVAGALYARASRPPPEVSSAPLRAPAPNVAAGLPEPGPLAPAFAKPSPPVVAPARQAKKATPGKTVAERPTRDAKRVRAAPTCGPGARCSYSAVLAADARLRRAYRAAQRAGVARPVLVSYRNRWAGLRGRATHDPGRVVRGYRQMASELEQMARRGGVTRTSHEPERWRLPDLDIGGFWR